MMPRPEDPPAEEIAPEAFFAADIRLGRIVQAEPFPEARKPAYKLQIDFGPGLGVKKSSAQITEHYTPETLKGRTVLGVVNFPPRQIGPVRSEVLVLGVHDEAGRVLLLSVDGAAPLGARVS
ncbi:MAG: tRNA-binding protein [Oceanicaulis sp.]